ncbi:MAG: hypothetical protein JWO36_7421 [Myxococcales bacterium]|nr:hypothetical protein [Myxococcales bacterium]
MSFLVIPIGVCVAGLAVAVLPAVPLEVFDRPRESRRLGALLASAVCVLVGVGVYLAG